MNKTITRAALTAALFYACLTLTGCKLTDGDKTALARYEACMRQHAGADQMSEYWKEACRNQANAPHSNGLFPF